MTIVEKIKTGMKIKRKDRIEMNKTRKRKDRVAMNKTRNEMELHEEPSILLT